MQTKIDEIGPGIYRLSIFTPEVARPAGFTYNHFLILGDEPLLFHCGRRKMFPLVSEAVAKIIPVDRLRWLTFGHFEADECGSMNEWLAAAPHAQLAHGMVGCHVSVADLADRPPRVLSDGEVVDIGGKRLRYIDTPHVPHGWDAGVIFEEETTTLFCGDFVRPSGQSSRSHGGRHHRTGHRCRGLVPPNQPWTDNGADYSQAGGTQAKTLGHYARGIIFR